MSGNNKNIFLAAAAAAVIIAAGAGFYFTQKSDEPETPEVAAEQQSDSDPSAVESASSESAPSAVESAAGDATDKEAAQPNPEANPEANPMASDDQQLVVEPGNPIVAKVDGKDITRVDVYRFIQTMPPNLQQLPASTVYPMAMEQVINTRIVQNKADSADITESEEFKKEMEIAEQQIARNLYLQKEVDSKIDEAKIKSAYQDYINKMPDIEERHAQHILVETEEKANEALEKLKAGEKFEVLAESMSVGPTAPKGGDLGYFAKNEMVPEFANAAFSMEKGTVTEKPVKTQFGWHVIKLVDVRQRSKPTFEQVAPMIQAELRREVLNDLLDTWRQDVKVEQFDINGKPLKKGADATGLVPPAESETENQGG